MDEDSEKKDNFSSRVSDTFKKGILPKFLGGKTEGGDAPSGLKAAETSDSTAADDLKSAESNAESGGLYRPSGGVDGARKNEQNVGGLYTGGKVALANVAKKSNVKGKLLKFAPILIIFVVIIFVVGAIAVGSPLMMIGGIDRNLQRSTGWYDGPALIERQVEFITSEDMKNGRVPSGFASDLADAGLYVGQVTASGDFVRTDTYLANLDDSSQVASSSPTIGYQSGELVMRYGDEIITADNLVATLDSNPKMYAAYSDALNIVARYYYNEDIDKIYQDMGISRNNFNDWKSTGYLSLDEENFRRKIDEILAGESDIGVASYTDGEDENVSFTRITGSGINSAIGSVAEKVKGSNATEKAAQLLNTAISSSEPYKAAKAFVAIEEPIQKAIIEEDGKHTGPINEVMSALSTPTEIKYKDADTGEEVTVKKSILETTNFVAAVSNSDYSKTEASSYSRDRILDTLSVNDLSVVNDTTVATKGVQKSSSVIKNGFGSSADSSTLSQASSALELAFSKFTTEQFSSPIGANRIVEGGSFISNSINSIMIGAMASDSKAISEYHRDVDEIIARRENAIRATTSPFDISSPYTFLGSIVDGLSKSVIKSSSSGSKALSGIGAIADLTHESTKDLANSALADGSRTNFTELAGDCVTVKNASNVEGDLYCNAHNTVSTKYMKYTADDWSNIINQDDYDDFVVLATERKSTVGVESSEVCEDYKSRHSGMGTKISDAISKVLGLYNSCNTLFGAGDGEKLKAIATGGYYTLSDNNSNKATVELYSAYSLYERARSMIDESETQADAFRREFYAAHPRDDSREGKLARISGLSKADAKTALDYMDYLSFIARYDPSTRYSFIQDIFVPPKELNFDQNNTMINYFALIKSRETAYRDIRNRSFAA